MELIRTAIHTVIAYAWWGGVELETWTRRRGKKSRPIGRHVLLIAFYLPPAISSGSFRPASFLRYGSKLGWRLTAISGPLTNPLTIASEEDRLGIPKTIHIHRISKTNLRPSWRFFPRFMEDEFCNMLSMYSLAVKKFERDPPSIVIASGPPFTTFVAAYFLARRMGAKLVLDYRDEWSERPFDFVPKGNCDLQWERRCLRAADAVVFTTKSQLSHQLTIHPDLHAEKCYLIPNGWEHTDFKNKSCLEGRQGKAHEDVWISYVGLLGMHTRPSNFLNLLDQILSRRNDLRRRIKLRFVGQIATSILPALRNFRYQDILEIVDHVPKPEAAKLMRDSSGLLILAEPELERYLPGKLYDYIAAGPSILVYGHRGEASELVERLGVGIFVPEDDAEGLEQSLSTLCNTLTTVSNRSMELNAWLEQHTREVLARRFFDILESL